MPRSFLLRRSFRTEDERKIQRKGGSFGNVTDFGKQESLRKQFSSGDVQFWLDSSRKSAMDKHLSTSYTYQSYIDGDLMQKNLPKTGATEILKEAESLAGTRVGVDEKLVPVEENVVGQSNEIATPKPHASGAKPVYRCEQCGKTFKTKYTLTIHLKMPNHTGARPFVCNICGKGFRLSSTLCRHKIIHTNEKPHQCHICQKAFNRSSTLKTHVRTHSEKKEFICDVCGKGFHQKGNLRNHFLIHTGEKPYPCQLCSKAFNKLSNLKFHLHIHTDNTPYRCRYCKTAFTRRCDLKQHIRIGHGQDPNTEYSESDEL